MKVTAVLIIVVLMISACSQETNEITILAEGAYCLPYTPVGQSVYDTEWTGEYPAIESLGDNFKTATFGMGCFWGPAAEFAMVEGVIRTRVGYTGGDSLTPSYDNLDNHIEVIEVDYNPSLISYEQLIQKYFELYNGTERPYSLRVKSVIFYRSDDEYEIASKVKADYVHSIKQGVYTEIDPIDVFFLAEDKHQLSYLKQEISLYNEIKQIFPNNNQELLSILASKLNGIIAGYGSEGQISDILSKSALSEASINRVMDILSNRNEHQ